MFKQLFFDDQRLLVRTGCERIYGTPQLVATYRDKDVRTAYGWVWVLEGIDGKMHMLYMGYTKKSGYYPKTMAAVSENGIDFVPRETSAGCDNVELPHQALPDTPFGEVAAVFCDPKAAPEERYKILFSDDTTELEKRHIIDSILVSPDLIHFKQLENSNWNPIGTEPLAGAFYNPVSDAYTFLPRPDWGQRRVGVCETKDFHNFTPIELCLQCDSMDAPLAEIYGMPAFEYDGWFIGFPHIYSVESSLNTKFFGGTMHCEIAYSLNGHHWQRSLRTPFIAGARPNLNGVFSGSVPNMVFVTSMRRDKKDGSIFLYGTANKKEHGCDPTQLAEEDTAINVYHLREDGFVGLRTLKDAGEAEVALRDILWDGGDVSINIETEGATVAVYENSGSQTPIEGMSHEDCVPFAGSSIHWTPQWTSGKTTDELKGKTLVFDIRFKNGTLWSVSGNGQPMMNSEADRYRKFGQRPLRKGF